MADVNLLPSELAPNRTLIKLSKRLKKLALAGFILLLVSALVSTAGIFILKSRLDESISKQEELKNSIRSLEASEKKLFLIKDRLGKINSIYSRKSAWSEIENFKIFLVIIPSDAKITDVNINVDSTSIKLEITNSLTMAKFFSDLIVQNNYTVVSLNAFEYSKDSGFDLSIDLIK